MKIVLSIRGCDLLEKKLDGATSAGFIRKMENVFSSALKRLMPLTDPGSKVEVSVSFVKDEVMKGLNKKYREIDSSTDILSFPLWEEGGEFVPPEGWETLPLGDLIVSLERVAENAKEAGKDIVNELVSVMSHGLLHLLGFDHRDSDEKCLMWAEQGRMAEEFFSESLEPAEDKKILPHICTDVQDLLSRAKKALSNAYAPYSSFRVGAAILFEDGSVVTGCNVENASIGLSICAERNAMTAAVALGKVDPVAIAISGADEVSCPPCGACRQFLSEFNEKMSVIFEEDGRAVVYGLDELLPVRFKFSAKEGKE